MLVPKLHSIESTYKYTSLIIILSGIWEMLVNMTWFTRLDRVNEQSYFITKKKNCSLKEENYHTYIWMYLPKVYLMKYIYTNKVNITDSFRDHVLPLNKGHQISYNCLQAIVKKYNHISPPEIWKILVLTKQ